MTGFIVGAGVTLLGTLLNLILKKFVTQEVITNWGIGVKKTFNALGIAVTVGLSKMPLFKDIWNSIIEPYVIIVLEVIAMNAVSGLVQGLETDKPSLLVDERKET
jgi:hypothetical protein